MFSFREWIAIDWSGAKGERSASIVVAKAEDGGSSVALVESQALWSRKAVADWLVDQAKLKGRLFVGIDSNFGYAAAVIRSQFPGASEIRSFWREIEGLSNGEEHFYGEAVWRKFPQFFWTEGKQPFPLIRRETELACERSGFGFPESPFKLIGPKQVGKGGLAAMRMAHYLDQTLKDQVAFWPFDDEERIKKARIVISEIYPRLFIKMAGLGVEKVRDRIALEKALSYFHADTAVAAPLSDHQTDALISAAALRFLGRDALVSLSSFPAVKLEGWIFGVKE